MKGKIFYTIIAALAGFAYSGNPVILCKNVNKANDSLKELLSRKSHKDDSLRNHCLNIFETKYLNDAIEAAKDTELNLCRAELKRNISEIASLRKNVIECVDTIVKDTSKFIFDPKKSFSLIFARYRYGFAWKFGSLDTGSYYQMQVQRDGPFVNGIRTHIYCKNSSSIDASTMQKIKNAISENDIENLAKRYETNETDGSITIFRIQQAESEKIIYLYDARLQEISNVLKIIENRDYEERCIDTIRKDELFDNGKMLWKMMREYNQ